MPGVSVTASIRRLTVPLSGCMILALALSHGGPIVAQEAAQTPAPADETPANENSTTETAATDEATDEGSPEEVERRRKLRLAILTGGLIAVTGIAMVALTILGGSATRRGLRRKPLFAPLPPPDPIPAARFDEPADEADAQTPPADDQNSAGDRTHDPST